MRHRVQVALVLMAMCGVAASAVAQTVYKWTDAAGVTHYSEQPPPVSAKARQLQLNGSPPPASATAGSTSPPPQSTAAALDAAKSDFRKQACATANNDLKLLSGRGMVLDTGTLQNPTGVDGAKMLSAEQREAAKSEAQQQIQQFCDRG